MTRTLAEKVSRVRVSLNHTVSRYARVGGLVAAMGTSFAVGVMAFGGGAPATADSAGVRVAAAALQPELVAAGTPPGRQMGFVATYFYYAMYQGPEACPQGMQKIVTSAEFLKQFPQEERDRLLKRENMRELARLMNEKGKPGINVCREPWKGDDPNMISLSGDRNDGLNLDGSTSEAPDDGYSCGHKQYIGENNEPGIDNQYGRLMACTSGTREKGTLTPYFTQVMRDGMWSMLIQISNVDDRRNDPDVTVDLFAGEDTMVKDPTGNVLANASLAPKTDPRLHAQLKGRIVNGVLETTPISRMLIPDIMLTSSFPPMQLDRPRLKLNLLANGNAKGYLGGYKPIEPTLRSGGGDAIGEPYTGIPCNGMWWNMQKFADGGRDAKTGKCTTISTAFRIEAIPAFIVRPDKAPVQTFAKSR
ncbi:hypothetical protein KRR38_08860 [Novosphingobium sp. G106]|uniref:hypothetical protein n=1 Tax=Novosphingobium sp. G106 TaxID=2849500 RepID=UPI001C2CD6A6|nr:hypothetical protein [Novosphingobium sp. G106]MBV1687783.1 hypothetical protein [Novosphingobium sp. G106]